MPKSSKHTISALRWLIIIMIVCFSSREKRATPKQNLSDMAQILFSKTLLHIPLKFVRLHGTAIYFTSKNIQLDTLENSSTHIFISSMREILSTHLLLFSLLHGELSDVQKRYHLYSE